MLLLIYMNGKEWTSPQDKKTMVDFYGKSPQRIEGITGESLVRNLEWRIYTEWCCNKPESYWVQHTSYKGNAFDKWVRDETHYGLERAGYQWSDQQQRFDANGTFSMIYKDARDRVLFAIVKKAVEFFKDCRDYQWPVEGDSRNLRTSLGPYLK